MWGLARSGRPHDAVLLFCEAVIERAEPDDLVEWHGESSGFVATTSGDGGLGAWSERDADGAFEGASFDQFGSDLRADEDRCFWRQDHLCLTRWQDPVSSNLAGPLGQSAPQSIDDTDQQRMKRRSRRDRHFEQS